MDNKDKQPIAGNIDDGVDVVRFSVVYSKMFLVERFHVVLNCLYVVIPHNIVACTSKKRRYIIIYTFIQVIKYIRVV